MRLRRSTPYGRGLRRARRGRGFAYVDDDGAAVTDPEIVRRIHELAIPPAWRKVWICPYPNGHIQAVGVDAAGRRQYLYHEQWRRERDEEKFDRVLEVAARLPALREQVAADLGRAGLDRRRVEAVALGLLDRGVFRIGGEEYAEEHGTRGVATLLREQVRVSGEEMLFDYRAKGGIRRRVRIGEPQLARAVRTLRRTRAPSGRLLVYRDGDQIRDLHSTDINARFKELVGGDHSAKDFRTWQATVLAAAGLAATERPGSERRRRSAIRQVMTEVAEALGNTPAVARNSYVDPRVIEAWERGQTIEAALRRARRARSEDERQAIVERAVLRLLRAAARAH
ncbi:DNA topoisomerase IB [Nocardia sp. CDC159]|uniref:DNA topoisomerase n=1 Tax=Nocardia pulmonis TaxID=2951408 RepID=A0A9X2E180_9NOCA|nr:MULTISPECIES: DNA topoisomerase IB [Nocardia]MCM6772289.1 DNA topoisomerase IB [Nocardia pulmonis]MCM6785053.1 DNA topoisomerase IB [Nocardia sp. CDC159]